MNNLFRKFGAAFFAVILFASFASAQSHIGADKGRLILETTAGDIAYTNENMYSNIDLKRAQFEVHCKMHTFGFSANETDKQTLERMLNLDAQPLFRFKGKFPATFKAPAKGKSVKLNMEGTIEIAGVKTITSVPVTFSLNSKGELSYSFAGMFNYRSLGIKAGSNGDVKPRENFRFQFSN